MGSSEDAAKYPGGRDLSTAEVEGVARNAGVVGAATLVSRFLGLGRDIVLANAFAASATDAFFIAFMIPNLFRRLIGEGALTIAFVPVFTGWLSRSAEEARRVFNATWTLAALVGLAIAALGIVFAGPLVEIFAPGFAEQPGKLELTAELLRWCFPYIFFLTFVAVAMGALNALGHFLSPAIAPALLNLSLIAAALGFADSVEPPILVLGGAVIVAGVLQVAAQIPELRLRGMSPAPLVAPGHPAIRRLGVLMAPAVLGASVYQINLLVVRFLASFQGEGAVSYLYYADRLMELPLGVFIFALSMASLSSFARLAKQGETAALRQAFAGTLRLALALAVPSTVGLVLLREPIFTALFAWNAALFDRAAIEACSGALFAYALGLAPIALSRICVQLLVANENTRVPAQGAFVAMLVNLIAALVLIAPLDPALLPLGPLSEWLVALQRVLHLTDMGYTGLALATSIAATVNALFLFVAARRLFGPLLVGADWVAFGTTALASTAMGAAVWLALELLPSAGDSKLAALALLALCVAIGVAVYAAALALLRSAELRTLSRLWRRD
jgi:putative peptidoglycan lipid II flippase